MQITASTLVPTGNAILQQAAALAIDFVDLENVPVDRTLLALFPAKLLFKQRALPLSKTRHGHLRVALADPFNVEGISELAAAAGMIIETVIADERQIEAKLNESVGLTGGTVGELLQKSSTTHHHSYEVNESVDENAAEASVIQLVNQLLDEALTQGASDIHIEPQVDRLDIRFRVDGQLRSQMVPDDLRCFGAAIVNRLKIMAKLNIAERRLPQDGRAQISVQGRDVDLRVSVIPMLHGEGIVLRLLDQSRTAIHLDKIAFAPAMLQQWRQLITKPHGMLLVTGPTGSGKTTTLYASLAEMRHAAKKIITIEDPVEYQLNGISQIPVHTKTGLTFAAGLRAVLRHDPDVILIGEIRDSETAHSAVQAALTGHLVLSTLHTNDAASAFTRLTDMGVEPYLTASTVHAVMAQRLVRRLCHACRVPMELDPRDESLPVGLNGLRTVYREQGCRQCHGTGFAGRLAIFELLVADDAIRRLSSRNADVSEIRAAALKRGMTTLRMSGMQQVAAGETSIQEVLRVTGDDDTALIDISK